MEKVDLHVHTSASDSILSPEEVVRWASQKKLRAIAITDHDTIDGIEPAMKAAMKYNLEIIPGIELSTEMNNEEIHILGYFIDYKDGSFLEELDRIRNSRYIRAQKIICKLNELGFEIAFEEVEKVAENGLIGRPHIARVMISRGYISSIKEAFDVYLSKGCPAYVERYKLTTRSAIDLIKAVGGVPVLAHPGLIKDKSLITFIVEMGIAGIEVYHTKHDNDEVRTAIEYAKKHGLLITGGTDCHGIVYNNEPILGNVFIDYKYVEDLKSSANCKEEH